MKWDAGKLYCNTVIVLQLGSAGWQELYHNTLHCIVAETLAVGRIASQYSSLYYDRGKAWTVLQYSHRAHDTAKLGAGKGVGRTAARAGRRWGVGAGATGTAARAGVRGAGELSKRQRRAGQAASVRQASGARAAWALGTRAGYGLCTRCTRPIFGPV